MQRQVCLTASDIVMGVLIGSYRHRWEFSLYDAEIIREHSRQQGHVALINFNHRSPKDERQFSPHEAQRYIDKINQQPDVAQY